MPAVFTSAEGLEEFFPGPSIVTIGNFDGVHAGHSELLRRTAVRAAELGLPAVAVTFDPHPECLFSSCPPLALCSSAQKAELLGGAGMDAIVFLPFTAALAAESAESFCCRFLEGGLHATELFVGYDFRLGSDQVPGPEAFGPHRTTCVPAVMFSGKPVSSTRIRAALASCRLGEANAMLGRPFAVCGEVIRGAGRGGAVLGVPTANLDLPPGLAVPAPSVYATSARICGGGKDEPWRKSVTSFCKNPTFGGNALTMETHILDFSADIYGKTLEVRFLAQMRTEKRFSGIGELAAQLQADIRQRRAMDWS